MTTTSLSWHTLKSILVTEPATFLQDWYTSGRLKTDLPEIHALYGVPQRADHHPEIDTGLHTMLVVAQAKLLTNEASVLFAALNHDLGKALTPSEAWPAHVGHEKLGKTPVEVVCDRLAVPDEVRKLAVLVCEEHLQCHRVFELRPGSVIQWLERNGWLTDDTLLKNFTMACEADARGRTGFENREYLSGFYLEQVVAIVKDIMLDESKTHQIRLNTAVTAVKHHFSPFQDVQHRKQVVRMGANLAPPMGNHTDLAC